MLRRGEVDPFVRRQNGRVQIVPLDGGDPRVLAFAERLSRLVRRLVGCPRDVVHTALAGHARCGACHGAVGGQ